MERATYTNMDLELIRDTIRNRVQSGEHTDKSTADFINKNCPLAGGKKVHWSKVYQIRKDLGLSGRGKSSKQRSKKSRGIGAWAQPTGEVVITTSAPETLKEATERVTLADIRAALSEAQRLVDQFTIQVRREFGE